MVFVVRAFLDAGDPRQLTFPELPPLEALRIKLRDEFGLDSFRIRYVDDDGDEISISTNADWEEAAYIV
jgi:hypothetical protein